MADLFQNISGDVEKVIADNGMGDRELTEYVTIHLPPVFMSYFASRLCSNFIKVPSTIAYVTRWWQGCYNLVQHGYNLQSIIL